MRIVEIILPILLGLFLAWPAPRPLYVRSIPIAAAVLIVFHLFVEGYRWQMVPVYAIAFLLTGLWLFKADIKPAASFLTLGLLALSTALPALLPVPAIPKPSGPYQIGTSIFELTDLSRKELYSGKDEPRRFMIQVWYPAEVQADDVRAPWISDPDIYTPAISTFIDMPPFFLDHLALVKIPAYKDSKVASSEKPFPIILFSHGWKGFNAQNSGQALELASRGFIVVAVQHTYGAIMTVFPDGTSAPNNPEALPADEEASNYEEIARILGNQWAEDLFFTLDQLQSAENEAGAFLRPYIDFNKVGAYGHSTGGGAVIQFCGADPRCTAVLGMDPFMRPVSTEVIENGLTQTSFHMFSQEWADNAGSRNNELFNRFYPSSKSILGAVSIEGTKHYDYSDLPLLSPIAPQLGLKGPLNGRRVVEIVNAYLVDFFEFTLKGETSELFADSSPFEEINFLK